jgi:hypothetical protein
MIVTREDALKDDFGRMFILWQLYRSVLKDLSQSDTLAEWAKAAKSAQNKDFVNVKVLSGEQVRYMDTYMLKIKQSMSSETWNAIMSVLTGEQVKEISLLLDEIKNLSDTTIEQITNQIKTSK